MNEAGWLRTVVMGGGRNSYDAISGGYMFEALNQITGDKQRLEHNSALARSIRHRFPYIDPLHHLQVELVRRYRAGHTDERVRTGIHISINGIAAALRNTG